MQIIMEVVDTLVETIRTSNIFISIFLGLGIIVLESIFPILPLALFIATNVLVFGKIFGFVLSWTGTIIGCILSFMAFRKGFSKYLYHYIDTKKIGKEVMNSISNINFSGLVLLTAMPFTPAFLVNIACGLSKMSFRKYLFAMLLAKISIVYFWGYVGTTFIESLENPIALIKLGIILIITYIISHFICKKFNIN